MGLVRHINRYNVDPRRVFVRVRRAKHGLCGCLYPRDRRRVCPAAIAYDDDQRDKRADYITATGPGVVNVAYRRTPTGRPFQPP